MRSSITFAEFFLSETESLIVPIPVEVPYMPIPAAIAGVAGFYTQNTGFLPKAVAGLTPEQWLARPSDHSNHITWIVGHLIWSRHAIVNRTGGSWSCHGLEPFARSAKLDTAASYPAPEALLAL